MPEITRTVAEAAAMLEDGGEIAFLDVREIVPFGTGHPLLATHLALGHIECEIAGLVPRRDTRVIVTDGGEGLSAVTTTRSEPPSPRFGCRRWGVARHTSSTMPASTGR